MPANIWYKILIIELRDNVLTVAKAGTYIITKIIYPIAGCQEV